MSRGRVRIHFANSQITRGYFLYRTYKNLSNLLRTIQNSRKLPSPSSHQTWQWKISYFTDDAPKPPFIEDHRYRSEFLEASTVKACRPDKSKGLQVGPHPPNTHPARPGHGLTVKPAGFHHETWWFKMVYISVKKCGSAVKNGWFITNQRLKR
jgi:hypothetical protein